MKHLKQWESVNSSEEQKQEQEEFKEISSEEADNLKKNFNIVSLDESTEKKMIAKFFDLRYWNFSNYKDTVRFTRKRLVVFFPEKYSEVEVFKLQDDYYLIRACFVYNFYKKSKYFLCEELKGMKDCLEDMKVNGMLSNKDGWKEDND